MQKSLIAICALVALAVSADETFVSAADPTRFDVQRSVKYRGDFTFDLYRPKGIDSAPVVIFVNITGGAYATWPIYIGWAQSAASEGIAAVVYQSAEEKATESFDDLIAYLRLHAKELRIDTDRIVLWSGSANVRLGLPLAMDRQRTYVRGAAVFYGSADVTDIRTDLPVLCVRSGLDNPGLNRQIDALIARAFSANASWIVENYGAGTHRFEMENDNDISREIIRRTLTFIKSVTKPDISRAYAAVGSDAALGAAFNRQDWATAIEGYKRRIASAPTDAEAHRRLGIALAATNQYDLAITEFESAWNLGRRGPRDTGYPAARAAARAGNVERTIYWLDIVMSTPFGPEISELRTSEDFAKVRGQKAFDDFLAALEAKRLTTPASTPR